MLPTSLLDVRPRMYGVGASASDHEVRCGLRIPFGTDIDQPRGRPTGKFGSGNQALKFVIVCFGLAKMKSPTDKTAPRDQKPPTARKPSGIAS